MIKLPDINSRQRTGILLFVLVLALGETWLWHYRKNLSPASSWEIDSLAAGRYDSLYDKYEAYRRDSIYPFNPNYLSDYKAYILGIDTAALNRIRRFRQSGKFFESKEHFRRVAALPDSTYRRIEAYVRIPVFRKRKSFVRKAYFENNTKEKPVFFPKQDINTATAEDLKKVYGIGEVLSRRIVKYRNRLGGFSIKEQLKDIYALSDEAYENLWQRFEIKSPVAVPNKIPLNQADLDRLTRNPYIDFDLAEKIVEYRSLHGDFHSLEELKKIPGFPADKYRRIVLYLRLE
ncbi:MAG: helix-hairpin-helix domain-containing protein [Chlorobi bacterium]|nr:helix-hairpin-helix domain-containing protein [Chlorobiota bacterium]